MVFRFATSSCGVGDAAIVGQAVRRRRLQKRCQGSQVGRPEFVWRPIAILHRGGVLTR